MRHEPSDSCLPLQPADDRRCSSCQTVNPPDDFSPRAGTPAGYCAPCRRRSAAVTRRERRALRQVARRAEASYRALLAQHTRQGDGGDAA
jgi:hypothetical protein